MVSQLVVNNMIKKFKYSGVLILCLAFSAIAQQKIHLLNEPYTPDQSEWDYTEDEVVNGKIYRLIQSPILKLNKTIAGIHTMDYIPQQTFVSAIEVAKLAEAQNYLSAAASYVIRFKPEWKLSQAFYQGQIPDHIRRGGDQVQVMLRFYRDIPASFIQDLFRNRNLNIEKAIPEHNLYSVIIAEDDIWQWANEPFIVLVEEVQGQDVALNFYSRASHRMDYVQNPNVMANTFNGKGVVVGVGDDGTVNHLDYNDRILQNAVGINQGDHGDHVTGTLAGAGIVEPTAKGAAPEAELVMSFFSDNLNNAPTDYDQFGVRLISGSYGSTLGCFPTSPYNSISIQTDNLPISRPTVSGLWAGGNEGGDNCSPVGPPYGTMSVGYQRAKNQITVANARRNNSISGSSSRGPTPDGRLKPDITGLGTAVYSTSDIPINNTYNTKSGTSMATPGVAGGVATMYEAYRHYNNGKDPLASTVKAVLLNTALDLGRPGPDFTYGYGKANFYRAHKAIEAGTIIVDSISSGINSHIIPVPSGSVSEVRVLVCWTDTVGNPSSSKILVNDLDMVVKQGGTSYLPWVLDPTWNVANLTSNAVRAVDSLNNVEQVTFTAPGSGDITIEINGSKVVTSQQVYSISYEFVMDSLVLINPAGGESYQPGTQIMISWVAGTNSNNFTLDYSLDSGATWLGISSNLSSSRRDLLWNAPLATTDKGLMRITRAGDTAVTAKTFSIIYAPQNLMAVSSCPDSTVILAWDSVPHVSQYVVYRLKAGKMDSIGLATDTFYIADSADYASSDEWYSVAPMLGNSIGVRSDALNKPKGLYNCNLSDDIEVLTMSSPAEYGMPDCYQTSGVPVRVNLVNHGSNDAFNFVVNYSFNGGVFVPDTIKDTIAPGATYIHEFAGSALNLLPNTNYDFEFLVDYDLDRNPLNDTLRSRTRLVSSFQYGVPYLNNFEGFNACGTASNCGQTNCVLNDGWNNLSNTHIDDHDFRVISGPTPSAGTGPNQDYIPGSATGKYLYLEASSGCDSAEAILMSPCLFIDTSAAQPTIEYAYHMYGGNMGKLNIDLITETGVVLNVVPEVSGNQGASWIVNQIDMLPYSGQVVTIRFRAKTGNSYESDLSLDYFNLFDQSVTPPTANFGFQFSNTGCIGDNFIFQDSSTGAIDTYTWDFGPNATPATATGSGPHTVSFSKRGPNPVQLQVTNGGGLSVKTDTVQVLDVPGGFFTFSQNSNIVSFTDVSSFNPSGWLWDFGDGNSSTQQNPVHTYTSLGTFTVKLLATNACGTDDYEKKITVNWIGIPEVALAAQIKIYPNPANDNLFVELPEELADCKLVLTDLSGKVLQSLENPDMSLTPSFDLGNLSRGLYMLRINHNGSILRNIKLVKEGTH